jgi:hypothetical protein
MSDLFSYDQILESFCNQITEVRDSDIPDYQKEGILCLSESLEFKGIPPTDWINGCYYKEQSRSLDLMINDQAESRYVDYINKRIHRINYSERDGHVLNLVKYHKIAKEELIRVFYWLGLKKFKDVLNFKREGEYMPLSIQFIDSGLITNSYLVKFIDDYQDLLKEYGDQEFKLPGIEKIRKLKEMTYDEDFWRLVD